MPAERFISLTEINVIKPLVNIVIGADFTAEEGDFVDKPILRGGYIPQRVVVIIVFIVPNSQKELPFGKHPLWVFHKP